MNQECCRRAVVLELIRQSNSMVYICKDKQLKLQKKGFFLLFYYLTGNYCIYLQFADDTCLFWCQLGNIQNGAGLEQQHVRVEMPL